MNERFQSPWTLPLEVWPGGPRRIKRRGPNFREGRGARGGGGVTTILPGPPFLQREKRLVRGDLISNSRRR